MASMELRGFVVLMFISLSGRIEPVIRFVEEEREHVRLRDRIVEGDDGSEEADL